MNVLQNLVNMYNALPIDSNYRSVLKAILLNVRHLGSATIYEIAELTASSRTTIWRLVKTLGYRNFSDFSHELSSAVTRYPYYNRMDMGDATPGLDACADKVRTNLKSALAALDHLDAGMAARIVDRIDAARRVGFYGFEGNPYIRALQENLAMNGKESNCFVLLPDMLRDAAGTDADSLTFVRTLEFSTTMDLAPVFETLRKRGGTVALLHSGTESRHRKHVDFVLNELYRTTERTGVVLSGIMTMALLNELYRGRFVEA